MLCVTGSRAINQWRIQEGVGGGYDPFRDLTEEIFFTIQFTSHYVGPSMILTTLVID